jgi:hypothetical protein
MLSLGTTEKRPSQTTAVRSTPLQLLTKINSLRLIIGL